MKNLEEKIRDAINECSVENGSNTPDFILAKYLTDCLLAFNEATCAREKWYGKSHDIIGTLKDGSTLAIDLKTD